MSGIVERLEFNWDKHSPEIAGLLHEAKAEIERLRAALREDHKYLAGLCGCAASSGCGAAIRRAEIDRLLVSDPDEGLPTAEDVRGILKPGKNER